MIFRSLNIRGWRCYFFFAIDSYGIDTILDYLGELDAPPAILQRVQTNMLLDKLDTGFTYSNPAQRASVVVLGRQSTGAEFLNSFVHEVRHLTDDIASAYGYPMRGEKVAYLTGEIALHLAEVVCQQCCEECRASE